MTVTPSQLKEAASLVEGAGLPPDLQPVAYRYVLDRLTVESGTDQLPQEGRGVTRRKDPAETDSQAGLDQVAMKLGVSAEDVAEVYAERAGELELVVPASKLPREKRSATRQLALLVASGRQAGGYDESWTDTGGIRAVVTDFGKFDSANFAATLAEMSDVFVFRGKGRSRQVRVTRGGYEAAAELIRELIGGSQ